MQLRITPLIGALLLLGCVGGQVSDLDTRAPLNGVRVTARACETCTAHVRTTARSVVNGDPDSVLDGVFEFNPYEDGPWITGQDDNAIELTFERAGYPTLVKYVQSSLQTYRHASGEDRYAQVLRVSLARGPDSDGDRLSDAEERVHRTDPADHDTDDDGLWDGWEVHGDDFVDYAGLGADPRRKDLLVELDYQAWTEGGVKHSAALSPAVIRKLKTLYASLDVANPNGVPGIALHVLQNGELPRTHDCESYLAVGDPPQWNRKRRKVFRYGQLCFGAVDRQWGRTSGAKRFFAKAVEPDLDPSNDETEPAQGTWLAVVAHELGHTLGLSHGGGDNINCKPNYPSLMNYVYLKDFLGSPLTLRDTRLQFSRGFMPALDEAALVERNPFPGYARADLELLRHFGSPDEFGFALHPSEPWVDWNRDGTFQSAPQRFNVTAQGYVPLIHGEDACEKEDAGIHRLVDFNDGAQAARWLTVVAPPGPGGATLFSVAAPADHVCRF